MILTFLPMRDVDVAMDSGEEQSKGGLILSLRVEVTVSWILGGHCYPLKIKKVGPIPKRKTFLENSGKMLKENPFDQRHCIDASPSNLRLKFCCHYILIYLKNL